MKTLISIVLTIGTLLSSCAFVSDQNHVDQVGNSEEIRILFIGNSLTYTNDLPSLVVKEAKGKKVDITTEMIAYPNYALEDHWNDGKMQTRIEEGKFNYVIVQQGPSSQTDGREMLFLYGSKIAALCKKNNAKLVFFMVWPAKVNFYTFNGVITNYRDAALKNESVLCPVGEVWKKHMDETQDFSYYGDDGFHPSWKGSQVAAKIIVDKLVQ